MAAHAHSKNEFTEDEKYHNLMTRIILLQCEEAFFNEDYGKYVIWEDI